jgi:hypothetical protein
VITGEVATKLTAASLTTGYEVLRGKMPSSPDKVIALFETGGAGPQFFLGATDAIEEPSLQVRVRGAANDYDGPRLTIEAIFQALLAYGAFTVSSVRYLSFTPLQSPYPLRRDENQRVEWAVNFLVQKELS